MRRRGLTLGLLVLVLAWFTPLRELVPLPFVGHMLVHVAVLAVAAPLIGGWLGGVRRAGLPWLEPLPAAAFGFGIVWLWHMPFLHGLALLSLPGLVLQQLSLLGAGLLVWTSALCPSRPAGSDAVLGLLVTSTQLAVLGTLLTLAPAPLYGHGIDTLGDAYAELAGQRLGGLSMLTAALPYLAAGLWVVARRLRGPLIRPVGGSAGKSRDGWAAGIDIAGRAASAEGDSP